MDTNIDIFKQHMLFFDKYLSTFFVDNVNFVILFKHSFL
jgi:hypothetical protein